MVLIQTINTELFINTEAATRKDSRKAHVM